MEPRNIAKITLLLGGGFIYNFLFNQENLGMNLIIFSFFLVLIGLFTCKETLNSKGVQITLVGVILSGIMVALHHSLVARFVHFTSLVVFVGFLYEPKLKAIYHAIAAALFQWMHLPKVFASILTAKNEKRVQFKRSWRWIKLIVIPAFAFLIFYVIFYYSNPVFSEMSDTFWSAIGDFFSNLFQNVSIVWLLQFVLGMLIVSLFLFKSIQRQLTHYEQGLQTDIKRNRKKRFHGLSVIRVHSISLKNEYRSALVLIGSINVLLLIINAIDIHWIWFNFTYDPSFNLSQLVHEGTYLLILSILLSMGILLYFFRRNLNFFPNNVWLRRLANAWIFQNAVLVISVIVRNYHYMYHFGLAYKRIGVMFFLTAVIVGLVTLFIKINKAKTSFYLLKVNSWTVYGLFLIVSCVNWDIVIVNHNIQYTQVQNMDSKFLLSLSDKTLPAIHKNRNVLNLSEQMEWEYKRTLDQKLEDRIATFMKKQRSISWKSWNYADQEAFDYFVSQGK